MIQGLYQEKPPLPFVPGLEVAGIVKGLGIGVSGIEVGDRVFAWLNQGGFAEDCVADARHVIHMPEAMTYDSGAALPITYCTSLHALRDRARLRSGETLLVLGAAGGVGTAAIEIGKALGARVIAAASSHEKLAACRRIGADETIAYGTEDLRKRALQLTDGNGVDVVYDPVGGSYSESALRATSWHGRLLVVGFSTGELPKLPSNLALLMERSIMGVYWGSAAKRDPVEQQENVMQLLRWFNAGQINPIVADRVPLEGAAAAMARLTDRQAIGKIVVLPEAAPTAA